MTSHEFLTIEDPAAEQALATLVDCRRDSSPVPWSPELAGALAEAFGLPDRGVRPATKGELARAALNVLARDEHRGTTLMAPIRESFGPIPAATLITAAVLVLKSHVTFERGADGKVSVKVETQSLSNDLLKVLVETLLGVALRA